MQPDWWRVDAGGERAIELLDLRDGKEWYLPPSPPAHHQCRGHSQYRRCEQQTDGHPHRSPPRAATCSRPRLLPPSHRLIYICT
eukprot:scaffold189836_cov33-Tisochrysis_lutea.AAC.3